MHEVDFGDSGVLEQRCRADRAIRLNPNYQPRVSELSATPISWLGHEDALKVMERQTPNKTPDNNSKYAWVSSASLAVLGRGAEAERCRAPAACRDHASCRLPALAATDTHLRTSASLDAAAFGTRLGFEDAYRSRAVKS
ncbi:hypothetical protein [Sinorhizobium fredii]|uniref:Uncharacterized protein n=1 Tax=Rhizobium fredii TaxID=380 RepID=A0A2A6LP50_RHIFR|nr:hypothetical protein [Sinorhizobium fredii]PDT44374.1 hypothetical protein CO661_29780 [Sinorhizobium fredii]